MAKRMLDDWLKAYMRYTAFSEAPDDFHFWVGISTIAGALRRRVWIDQGYFQWTPNFYIIFVAPPGIISKSTTMSIGMNLLRQLEHVKFGPDSITWQSLTQSLAAATVGETDPANGKIHPMSCMTIASSEFGTFINPSDREMIDVLVSLWDGQIGTWERITKTQGKDMIQNPWLNVIACTTPAWISGNFPEYLIGGGFTSRCIFVFGEKKRQYVAYPGKEMPPELKHLEEQLVHDLRIISEDIFGAYELDNEALALGKDWYTKHYNDYEAGKFSKLGDRFGGYIARKQTHIHKLAMVLTAATRNERVIRKRELELSIKIVSMLEDQMPQVFERIGKTDVSKRATEVVQLVRSMRSVMRMQLYQHCFRTMSWKEFEEALQSAMQAGILSAVIVGTDYKISYIKLDPTHEVPPMFQPPSGPVGPTG